MKKILYFTPYLFILSFFTVYPVYANGMMPNVQITDAVFLPMLLAFVFNKKISVAAALEKRRFLVIAMAAFALWAAVGFVVNFYSHTRHENFTSLIVVLAFFEMAAMAVLFSQPQWREERGKFVLFYMICSCCEVIAAVLLGVLFEDSPFADSRNNFTGTLGRHHAMLGNVMALSLGIAGYAFYESRGKSAKVFSLCAAVLSLAAILLSGARSAFLGMALALPVIVLLHLRGKIAAVILSVAAVSVVLEFSFIKETVIHTILYPSNSGSIDLSNYGRLLIWDRVYEHALHCPWAQKIAGIGVGTFSSLRGYRFMEPEVMSIGAHNHFLNAFVETGIIGFILFSAIFIDIIKKLLMRSRRDDYSARCFLFCTLILLFSGLTQETFWFSAPFGRFWCHYMFFYLVLFGFDKMNRESV